MAGGAAGAPSPSAGPCTPGFPEAPAAAHWVGKGLVLWRAGGPEPAAAFPPSPGSPPVRAYSLLVSPTARFGLGAWRDAPLDLPGPGLATPGGDFEIPLEVAPVPREALLRRPHLRGCSGFHVPACEPSILDIALRSQVLCVERAGGRGGAVTACTGVQLAGVLDDVRCYSGPLGPRVGPDGCSALLWAPTAKGVTLELFDAPRGRDDAPDAVVGMRPLEGGAWEACGPPEWEGRYYRFRFQVYHPLSQRLEELVATDPYSRALAADGARSQFVDLSAPAAAPAGWATLNKPPLDSTADAVLYELHCRDFSAADEGVPERLRGKYGAFSAEGSQGAAHLRRLAHAGMTHVHLLPVYDFGSVPERAEDLPKPQAAFQELRQMTPDGEGQQAATVGKGDYNWGYDPVHFGVPEGSYSVEPDGAARVREFREAVAALNRLGLRVVVDVVYNHTYASGPHGPSSVLDKVVPFYYHRLSEEGHVEASTCCNNTASEHVMMERLIVDDLVHWAKTYKVDGFRFDCMGHLMLGSVKRAREALSALTEAEDGVEGEKLLMYGEGWDFGEVADNARGRNACQTNLGGSSVGSFNDRFRDAALGPTAFGDLQGNGFLTGLGQAKEVGTGGEGEEERRRALELGLALRLGLAGNLADFRAELPDGQLVPGRKVPGPGGPVAYAAEPTETVNYAACHDNMTLYDLLVFKSRGCLPRVDLCRASRLITAALALAQGLPFFHSGDELLRSKSFDRDSYNAGDWFNALDWTGEDSRFGAGLPGRAKNEERWGLVRPLLERAAEFRPGPEDVRAATAHLEEFLRVRKSSPLFRLKTAEEVMRRMHFLDSDAPPGVVIWTLVDGDEAEGDLPQLDPVFRRLVVALNATPGEVLHPWGPGVRPDAGLRLHPELRNSADPAVRRARVEAGGLVIPGRTAAVFVEERS